MIYLASPYTSEDPAVRKQRFYNVCRVAAALIDAGEVVFAPIAHSVPIGAFGLPNSWAFWRGQDTAFLERCDELVVLMLDGWEESVGVRGEIQIATELGMPIRYLRPADVPAEPPQTGHRAFVTWRNTAQCEANVPGATAPSA